MSDSPSKLDALADLLDVQDDTAEIDRPAPRRAVGEVLRGDTPDRPAPAVEVTETTTASRSSQHPRSEPRTPPPASAQRAARSRQPRQRSSANLPIRLANRLADAKRHRWELSELVVSALDHVEVDPAAADRILDESWNDTRVQRAYQVTAEDVQRLETLGERWRMNRSQVLAVILPGELDRLEL